MSHKIEYSPERGRTRYAVKLEGRTVGHIKPKNTATLLGWAYFPKGDKQGGKVYSSLAECKASLESDTEQS